ncbi:MAG: asparagine synthase-related protein, partial [Methanosarcinales archaeon]
MDELGDIASEVLFNSNLRKRNYFNYDFIKQMLELHRRKKRNYSKQLWLLLNLNLWYDYWIEGEDIGNI